MFTYIYIYVVLYIYIVTHQTGFILSNHPLKYESSGVEKCVVDLKHWPMGTSKKHPAKIQALNSGYMALIGINRY